MNFLFYAVSYFSGSYVWHNIYFVFFGLISLWFVKKRNISLILFLAGFVYGLYLNLPYIKTSNLLNKKIEATGEISDVNIAKKHFILKTKKISGINTSAKIIVFSFNKSLLKKLKNGNIVKCFFKLQKPEILNPGVFNYKNYLLSRGILFKTYLKKISEIKILQKSCKKKNIIHQYRDFIKEKIEQSNIPDYYKGFVVAITTGDKSFISKKGKNFLIVNGLSHLYSISGLHVGIFFVFTLVVLRLLFYRTYNYYLPFLLSAPAVILYVLFMGGNYPAVRAGFIFLFLIISLFAKRYREPLSILSFILFVMVLVNPYAMLNISFQFSFTIVYALIFYSKNLKNFKGWYNFFAVPLIAFLAGIPITCHYFSIVYFKSLIANLVAVPLFSFLVIPLSVLLIIFGWINFLFGILAAILYKLLWFNDFIINSMYDFKPFLTHSLDFFEITVSYMIVFTLIYLIAKIPEKKGKEFVRCGTAIIFLLSVLSGYAHFNDKEKVGIIDVGKGQCLFIKGKKNILIDTSHSDRVFKRTVMPVLLANRIKRIDYLLLTSFRKFSTGGVKEAVKNFPVKNIISNDKRICEEFRKIKCFSVKEGDKFADVSVLFPPYDKYFLLNYNTSSVAVSYGNILISGFLSGDIAEYLHFKGYNKFKALIAYKTNRENIAEKIEKIFVVSRRKERGYVEIFPDDNYTVKRFTKVNEKKSLLNLLDNMLLRM